MSSKCQCESWCYCQRDSIKNEIDKIPFIDSKEVIKERIRYWKNSCSGKYDSQIAQFIYLCGD